jgi:O-antigen/teichoic acid export membrane protein
MVNTDFKHNVVIVFGTKILLLLVRTLISIVIARVLGADGKGVFTTVLTLAGTFVSVFSFGFTESVTYFIAQNKLKENYLQSILLISVSLVFLSLIILYFVEPIIQKNILSGIPPTLINYVYLFIFFNLFNNLFSSFLKGRKEFAISNYLSIFVSVFRLALMATVAVFHEADVQMFIGISLIVSVTNSLYAYYYLSTKSDSIFSIANFKAPYISLFNYGIKSHVGSLLSQLEYQTDIFIMLIFLSPEAIGYYSISYGTALIIRYITNSLNNVLFPELSSRTSKVDAITVNNKVIRANIFLNGIASIMIIMIGYPLIYYGYGIEFKISYLIMIILIPGIWIDSVFRILLTWYKGINQPQISSLFTTFSLIINVILFYYFVPVYGIYGAGIATLATYIIRTIGIVYYYYHNENIDISEVLFIKRHEISIIYSQLMKLEFNS